MTTAEKLQKIDEGVEETIALNAELEQTLYGKDADKTLDENVEQTKSDFQAIKDKIVERGVEVADGTRTAEYASKVDDVFEAGKKAEYDAFWDAFQANGTRTNYRNAFSIYDYSNKARIFGNWDETNFLPKYPIVPLQTDNMPMFAGVVIDNFKEHCEKNNITIDLSQLTSFQALFREFNTKYLPDMDAQNSTSLHACFVSCTELIESPNIINGEKMASYYAAYQGCIKLVKIPILWCEAEMVADPFYYALYNCSKLEEIGEIRGTINRKNFSTQWCPLLNHDSIVRIINALSTTTSGLAVNFSKTAVNNAFETSEGAADGSTSTEWTTLIGTKTNWTISLV